MKGPVFTPKYYKMGGGDKLGNCAYTRGKKSKQKRLSLRGSTWQIAEFKTAIMVMFKELKTTMLKRSKGKYDTKV